MHSLRSLSSLAFRALSSGDAALLLELEATEFHPLFPSSPETDALPEWKLAGERWIGVALREKTGASASWMARRFPILCGGDPDDVLPSWLGARVQSASASALAALEPIALPKNARPKAAAGWARLALSSEDPAALPYFLGSLRGNPLWARAILAGPLSSEALPLELADLAASHPSPRAAEISEWIAQRHGLLAASAPDSANALSLLASRAIRRAVSPPVFRENPAASVSTLLPLAPIVPPHLLRPLPDERLAPTHDRHVREDQALADALGAIAATHSSLSIPMLCLTGPSEPNLAAALQAGWIRPAPLRRTLNIDHPAAVRDDYEAARERLGREPGMGERIARLRSCIASSALPEPERLELLSFLDLSEPYSKLYLLDRRLEIPSDFEASPQALFLCWAWRQRSGVDSDFLRDRCLALSEAGFPLSESFSNFLPSPSKKAQGPADLLSEPWAQLVLEREALAASAPEASSRPKPRRV